MEGKLFCILALVVYAGAASIGGYANLGPVQAFANGGIGFKPPSLPFFSTGSTSSPSNGSSSAFGSLPSIFNNIPFLSSSNATRNGTNSPFGPFAPFLNMIPGLENLLSAGGLLSGMFPFPNIEDLVSRIRNSSSSDGNPSFVVPSFSPNIGFGRGPYIPGVSEALGEARKHLMAALNITTDLSTGLREAVQIALDSDHPVDSIGVILNTIAKVYSTVAANCPIMIVGHRVFAEGVRLAFEVARSLGNVVVGTDSA